MIKSQSNKLYTAHVRSSDKATQTVAEHLQEVAAITKTLAAKINVPEAGELIGLLHDFGKYSKSFQNYIQSGTGLIDPGNEDFVNAGALKGKIDHSTAGAQWVWEALSKGDEYPWVLEHHSNLEPENQTWHSKLAAENWDAPIVLTTMVQFLETLFSGGTRGVRRLHQLANSVIIFDEIQTLPINCTHLFCNALNFLCAYTKTTAVLCTATQPLLNKLPEQTKDKGQLQIPKENELIVDVRELFEQLKRVEISNKTKVEGWSLDEIAALALSEFDSKGNCLVIVNTKAWAQALYTQCSQTVDTNSLFHLSTNQCSAHRSGLFHSMRERLANNLPVLCFSTQLIEAGVDIDFASVIRFLAGLDSIAQAAGRCNRNGQFKRNGRLETAIVHVVNPAKETIDQLNDIKVGQEKTRRVFSEVHGKALLDPEVMALYFKYYFYERTEVMIYKLDAKIIGESLFLRKLL
jgi:CRISPR-associated endonuclease/helicase Cas3